MVREEYEKSIKTADELIAIAKAVGIDPSGIEKSKEEMKRIYEEYVKGEK